MSFRGYQNAENLGIASGATFAGDKTAYGRAIYAGTAGDIGLTTYGGQKVLLKNVVAGSVYSVAVNTLHGATDGSAATTATDILILS
jgi:hypothetical protein|tara:strand:- start:490 stop:750 length:261 start_codon:yes stop_codon:yes gene_type:complete